ncbi:MAG: DUF934 domain-containing protein [Psychrobacter sp.]|nr:DUF934 domain-containing protein [Psychrobacter sp.]
MGNHSILNSKASDITASDSWVALITAELPDGLCAHEIHLSEFLHKTERLDVILPLKDVLAPTGILKETLDIIANHSSRLGLWADTATTTEQLDLLLSQLSASSEATDTDTKSASKPPNSAQPSLSALSKIDLIVLYTPLFADGRNFSLAKHLRLQGYEGEIRVAGAFGRDQITYLLRSGVDSFIIANEFMVDDIANAFKVLPSAYSGNDASQLPMFRVKESV